MKTILATAYAINPYKGSEDGMGWNFVLQIARFNRVVAVTRENNRPAIEKYMAAHEDKRYNNITFLYYDLPYYLRFWKKGGRGAMLYYQMWQKGVVGFIRKSGVSFDIVHNLNFHNDWTPSYLWQLDKPFVWGPVGHHPLIPGQYLRPFGVVEYLRDRATWLVKQIFWKLNPSLDKTVKKADYIWCMNNSVRDVLDLSGKNYSVMPSVATQDFGIDPFIRDGKFRVISAGRFVALKGFDLTVRAFAAFLDRVNGPDRSKMELVLVGSGPEESRLISIIRELGIEDNVKIIHWIERNELMELFRKSDVFLFPSHEGAGMVVAEALSFGLPVICLDNSGPGEFIDGNCGFAVREQPYDDTVRELADKLDILYSDDKKYSQLRQGARSRFEKIFHWDRRGETLREVYLNLGA